MSIADARSPTVFAPNTPGPLTLSQLETSSYQKRRGALDPLPSSQENTREKKKKPKRKKVSEDTLSQEDVLGGAQLIHQPIEQTSDDADKKDHSLLTLHSRLDPVVPPESDVRQTDGEPQLAGEIKKKRRRKKKKVGNPPEDSLHTPSNLPGVRSKRANPQAEGESSPEYHPLERGGVEAGHPIMSSTMIPPTPQAPLHRQHRLPSTPPPDSSPPASAVTPDPAPFMYSDTGRRGDTLPPEPVLGQQPALLPHSRTTAAPPASAPPLPPLSTTLSTGGRTVPSNAPTQPGAPTLDNYATPTLDNYAPPSLDNYATPSNDNYATPSLDNYATPSNVIPPPMTATPPPSNALSAPMHGSLLRQAHPPVDVRAEVVAASPQSPGRTVTPDLCSTQDELSVSCTSSLYHSQQRRDKSVSFADGSSAATPAPPSSIVGHGALVSPEDLVYNARPVPGPGAAMFVARSDVEAAVPTTADVTYVERMDGRGFRPERSTPSGTGSSSASKLDGVGLRSWDRFYSSAHTAKALHSGIQRVLLFLSGLLAGVALMDAAVVYVLAQQPLAQAGLLQYYSPISLPLLALYQALFVLFLLSVVDRIDPSSWSKVCLQMYYQSIKQIFISAGWVLVLLAMLLTLGVVHIYEKIALFPTRPDLWSDLVVLVVPANGTGPTAAGLPLTHSVDGREYVYAGGSSVAVTLWQAVAALRALLCCTALLLVMWTSNADRLKAYLQLREQQGEKETD